MRIGVVAAVGFTSAVLLLMLLPLTLVDPLERVGRRSMDDMVARHSRMPHSAVLVATSSGAGRHHGHERNRTGDGVVKSLHSQPPVKASVALAPAATSAILETPQPAATSAPPRKVDVIVGAIVRGDAEYLIEWIEYHRLIGVGRFILFSNDCKDNGRTAAAVQPYVQLGILQLDLTFWCVSRGTFEARAWSALLKHAQQTGEWLIILTVNDFVVLRDHGAGIADVLGAYPGFDALALPVRLFGSSGFRSRPKGSVLGNYVFHAAAKQPRVRALSTPIVRVAECARIEDGRCAQFECQQQQSPAPADGARRRRPHCGCAVSPDKRRCANDPAAATTASAEPGEAPLWVNRYLTRSDAEWKKRQERGLATQADVELAVSTSLSAHRDLHVVDSVRIRVQHLAASLNAAAARGEVAAETGPRAADFLRAVLLARDTDGPDENPTASRAAASVTARRSTDVDMVVDKAGHLRPATWREKVRRAQHEHLNAARKRQQPFGG